MEPPAACVSRDRLGADGQGSARARLSLAFAQAALSREAQTPYAASCATARALAKFTVSAKWDCQSQLKQSVTQRPEFSSAAIVTCPNGRPAHPIAL